MKAAFRRAAFLPALEKIAKVAPTSKAVPIITYFRLEAVEPDVLWLSATDLVTSLLVTVGDGVAVKEPGTVLLDAHEFLTHLRSVSAPHVILVSTPTGVQSRIGPTAVMWKAPPLDQFPPIPVLEDRLTHTLPRARLLATLRLVKPAAATGAFQPSLEQVGIRSGKVLAADGIRYHEVALPGTEQLDIALPLPFLDDLLNLFGSATEETLDIGIPDDRRSIIARLDGTVLTTARKREDFPDVSHHLLLPSMANTIAVRLDRGGLLEAIRHVRVMADPATKAIRLQLSGTDFSTAVLSAQQPSGAWATESIPVEWAGGDRTLVFNHEYLSSLLTLFDTESVTLWLGEDARHKPSPVLINSDGRAGVLMQLRLDWT